MISSDVNLPQQSDVNWADRLNAAITTALATGQVLNIDASLLYTHDGNETVLLVTGGTGVEMMQIEFPPNRFVIVSNQSSSEVKPGATPPLAPGLTAVIFTDVNGTAYTLNNMTVQRERVIETQTRISSDFNQMTDIEVATLVERMREYGCHF